MARQRTRTASVMRERFASLDWGSLGPLRIRSRLVAEGVYAGAHRSARRGSGIEFGGHRAYVPGDDLRWLDRHALLRHGRLLVRQFETETDRALRIVVDATASMGYRGNRAPGAKLAMAALVGAALGRIAIASGDPVGLSYIGGHEARPVPVAGGREGFERILGSLEHVQPGGDAMAEDPMLDHALGVLSRAARRGSVIVVLSDLLDLPDDAADRFAALASRGRSVVVVRLLDPDELDLPFEGTVRLRSLEGELLVETDTEATRGEYIAALEALERRFREHLLARGAHLVCASTSEDPVAIVRSIVSTIR
ncbi:MAG TPA: DUF58 domain-containing protein [Polyangiaceae bacterium]|nr:DUF58 domain-containing protein [Polyangiaceae bacterium]